MTGSDDNRDRKSRHGAEDQKWLGTGRVLSGGLYHA
jgi:hypothetical protein